MMNRWPVIAVALLLSAACGRKEPAAEPAIPAVRAELIEATAYEASFSVQALNAVSLRYGTDERMSLSLDTGSSGPVTCVLDLSNLQPLTSYQLYLMGIGPSGEEGKVVQIPFSTAKGPDSFYPWEERRSGVPSFADLSLITMGWHNSNPPVWTEGRFRSHVLFEDRDGVPHWLYDAFLCIDGWDSTRNLSYAIVSGRNSAVKESWEDLLEAWLGVDGALMKLDATIDGATAVLGTPPFPRYVVMSIPDPIRYQNFQDKGSSTTYWGELYGKKLDFAEVSDQVKACQWYMDRCRERFQAQHYKHLELAGFYILSEELPLDPAFYKAAGQSYENADTWNWEFKNWEIIVPRIATYAHSCREGLWWIPYHLAPGYKVWKELGFDNSFMQPNYYWDHDQVSHSLSLTKNAIQKYRMGIELEFEYSLVASVMADGRSGPDGDGNPAFYAKDVPLLRERLREYMQAYKDIGLYGILPLAVYSGTDAMHQLATSTDPGDREMYYDLCQFIIGSPLKR